MCARIYVASMGITSNCPLFIFAYMTLFAVYTVIHTYTVLDSMYINALFGITAA